MFSFTISLVCLIVGYFLYGRYITKVFNPDNRPTPAYALQDGVDYVPMPVWKVYMIQFLNIAGTGPIFGAIMGAMFGPSSFLWIVFGCIFAGGVHDYMCGMLSVRNNGKSLPEFAGKYLGGGMKKIILVFTIIVLILVGAVFVSSPALLLRDLTSGVSWMNEFFWIIVIFAYYVIATLLPIDKIIGKIYPLFAFALLFMALGLMIALFVNWPNIPEVTDFATNRDPDAATTPIFPCLFITIACGAISGFHSTQSPLMARCLKHEKYGYPVFYGAMITEGIVALVWAAVSSYFFFDVTSGNTDMTVAAPKVVEVMSIKWLGVVGGVLAVLGVVAAPVTSGDTAFRSARLMIADALHIAQKKFLPRLYIAIPLFLAAIGLLFYNLRDPRGFNIIWGYFAWANQTLAVFTLWTITVYMVRNKKPYLVALIPAIFMTTVCATYTCVSAKNGFGLSLPISYTVSVICVITCIVWFSIWYHKYGRHQTEDDGSQSINKIEK